MLVAEQSEHLLEIRAKQRIGGAIGAFCQQGIFFCHQFALAVFFYVVGVSVGKHFQKEYGVFLIFVGLLIFGAVAESAIAERFEFAKILCVHAADASQCDDNGNDIFHREE